MIETQQAIIDTDDMGQRASFLSNFAKLTGKVLVTIKPWRAQRSLRANRYLWGVVYETFQQFMQQHGAYHEKEEIHEFFLKMHAPKPICDPLTGEVMDTVSMRSSKMNSAEFSIYVNKIIEWCWVKWELTIPSPLDFNVKGYLPMAA